MLDIEFKERFFPRAQVCLGVDEVGRGPLAGPVISCAVSVERKFEDVISQFESFGVCDSKKMTSSKRVQVLELLNIDQEKLKLNQVYDGDGFQFVLSEADHEVVDEMNIHHASLFAMKKALDNLLANTKKNKALILVDGKWIPRNLEYDQSKKVVLEPIIKGDSKSLLIGMASIIAKEYRDSLMKKLDIKYPGYGLGGHSGYPTPKHKLAIEELGPCPIHRKTFKGVKEFLQ